MNQNIIQYLQQQIRTTDERLKRFTHDVKGKNLPARFMFVKLDKYVNDFLNKKSSAKLVIIPGFRGVGKTTLISQVCSKYKDKGARVLFLSVEDAHTLFNAGISDLMLAFENILGEDLEKIKEPVLIFLDEIQSDPKWALTLKSLFERTSNIFFCCTGSSAVILQTTQDLARRAVFEKMPPMCFSEYEMVKNSIYPPKLKKAIAEAIYFSKNAEEAYGKLKNMEPKVNQFWSKASKRDIREYLSYGTLPFSMTMPNESSIYDAILLLIEKIIKLDLPMLGKFDADTINVVKRILFVMAESDTTSLNSLEKIFKINRLTISNILEGLQKAELLVRIPAYGSNSSVVKKPIKYLFMSPAFRMSFFYITGREDTYLTRQGKLLEDSLGSHLYREFVLKGKGGIRYDSAKGGADFILQISNNKQIIIEIGMGEKNRRQVVKSMKKIKSDYNLIFSDSQLKIDKEMNILFVPLDYYFLI